MCGIRINTPALQVEEGFFINLTGGRAMSALPNDPRVASLAYEVFMRGGLSAEAANAAREWKLRLSMGVDDRKNKVYSEST